MERQKIFIWIFNLLASTYFCGCSTLPKHFDRPLSYANTDTDGARLGTARRDEINAHLGQSGFLLFSNGLDAFLARALLAGNAERSIVAQYYLFYNDLSKLNRRCFI
jgi:putative cardiolipin synthase